MFAPGPFFIFFISNIVVIIYYYNVLLVTVWKTRKKKKISQRRERLHISFSSAFCIQNTRITVHTMCVRYYRYENNIIELKWTRVAMNENRSVARTQYGTYVYTSRTIAVLCYAFYGFCHILLYKMCYCVVSFYSTLGEFRSVR